MDSTKVIPVDLKEKRKQAGLTQRELAERLDVERETIVRAENDSVSFPLAIEYARIFKSIKIRKGDTTFVLAREKEEDTQCGC